MKGISQRISMLGVLGLLFFLLSGIQECEPSMDTGFTGTFLTTTQWGDGIFEQYDAYYDLYQYEDGDLVCWFTDWYPEDLLDLEEFLCSGSWDGDNFRITFDGFYPCSGQECFCSEEIAGVGIDDDGDGYYDRLDGVSFGDCPVGDFKHQATFVGERQKPIWQ